MLVKLTPVFSFVGIKFLLFIENASKQQSCVSFAPEEEDKLESRRIKKFSWTGVNPIKRNFVAQKTKLDLDALRVRYVD